MDYTISVQIAMHCWNFISLVARTWNRSYTIQGMCNPAGCGEKKKKEKGKKTPTTLWATSFPWAIFNSAIGKQTETSHSTGFSMFPGTIKIIYFCLKEERRKKSNSLNFQMVLQQIHPYPYLHVGGGASVSTLLKCTRKYFCIIPELHMYHPPWKYANTCYANSSLFCTYL